jgi:hypothetical protein
LTSICPIRVACLAAALAVLAVLGGIVSSRTRRTALSAARVSLPGTHDRARRSLRPPNRSGWSSCRGVSTVIVAQFGEPIADKTNAEKRLPVTTYPKLTGSWNWKWDQWRRRNAPSTETESG